MLKEIKGDLVKQAHEFDVIAQGNNCFLTMGAGIAKAIKEKFPEAYERDLDTQFGNKAKLGTITYTRKTTPIIINCYSQYKYGREKRHADYDAIRSCMKEIKQLFSGKKIGMPRIGCGLAGGDWNVVKLIIEEELEGEDVTIVSL